jgi:MFS transporter, PPP family, 3-phenylpropionic acid transporter
MDISKAASKTILTPRLSGSLYYVFSLMMAGSYMPFIYVYFTEIGLSGKVVGWLSTLSPIVTILFLTFIASVADRTRRRVSIAQIGMVGSGISMLLLHFFTSTGAITLLMFSLAVFSNPIMALGDGLVSRMAKRHQITYGSLRMWGSLSYAISSMVFGMLWQRMGYGTMFIVTALLYLPVIWIIGKVEEGPVVEVEKRMPVSRLFRDEGIVLLLLASFLSGISNSFFLTFGPIFARSLGASSTLIGLMVAFGGLAELPAMFYNERIANRLQKVPTVILAYALMAAGYLGYVLVKNPSLLPLITLIRGLGYGLWYTGTIRLLIDRTPEEWAATAQSLLVVCFFGLAPLLAGPLGGWIHDAISPSAVFVVAIISLILAGIVLWVASVRKKLS